MFRSSWKLLLVGTVVAVTLFAGNSRAEAFWGCCYTPYYAPSYTACYSPSYTACYDPCNYSCGWYVGYRPGPIRRFFFGPYRTYYGCYYGGGSYWSSGYYDVCCQEGATAFPTPAKSTPTPAEKPTKALPPAKLPGGAGGGEKTTPEGGITPKVPAETELPPIPGTSTPPIPKVPATLPDGSTVPNQDDKGLLTVTVPRGTKVSINGRETTSTGQERQYVSYGLKPGLEYKYEISAEVLCERKTGLAVERRKIPLTRTVYLRAGDHEHLTFTSDVVTVVEEREVVDPATGEVVIDPFNNMPTKATYNVVYVLDDDLKEVHQKMASVKQVPAGPRPLPWLYPTQVPTTPEGY